MSKVDVTIQSTNGTWSKTTRGYDPTEHPAPGRPDTYLWPAADLDWPADLTYTDTIVPKDYVVSGRELSRDGTTILRFEMQGAT